MIAFATPDTNVCVELSDDVPTSTEKVFVVTAVTVKIFALAGSVALGYGWLEALLSVAQVNVIPPSSILIKSPIDKPCEAVVIPYIPVFGLYVVPGDAVKVE